MFHPSWDFPAKDKLGVPNPRNYSDNPGHPFNRIVSALEVLGADILFASGNCGADCPDLRCYGDEKPDPIAATNAIYGANSHPSVLTIAGVDINNTRLGYSTQGPGRLKYEKPDLCGYTHFHGSGVDPIDGGTSAATPVVAGVVAAVRSRRPFQPRNPAASPRAIRNLMRATATDLSPGVEGYDFDHGYGVVGGCALYRKFETPRGIEVNPCLRPDPPWWCDYDICRRYPWLCQNIIQGQRIMGMAETNRLGDNDLEQLLEVLRRAGYHDGQHIRGSGATAAKSGGCSCSDKGSP